MQFENYDFGSAASTNETNDSRLYMNPLMPGPLEKSSNSILPLQLNTVDLLNPQPNLEHHQQQQQQQVQQQQMQHQPPRRNGSDPGLSPHMLLTPGVYDSIPISNDNYTHQTHQQQSSLSSLASMYSANNPNMLHHGLAGSSTTVTDSFFMSNNGGIGGSISNNGGNPSYEPITPPDYFPSLPGSNFESHSRQSSLNSVMWNQPSNNMKQLYSWSSNQNHAPTNSSNNMNISMNVNGHGHGHSISHMSSGVDLDLLTTVPEIPASLPNGKFNHMKCASMDDAHQRFSRQKFVPMPQSKSLSFEKQFQQLSVSNSKTDLNSQPGHGSSLSISFSHSSINPSSSSVPIPVASQTHKRSSTLPIAAPNPSLGNSADILNLSKDQYGCRILQKRIDDDFSGSYLQIFHAVYQHSFELMIDPFGNYLIQKIMINASNEELNLILINVTGLFGTIAKNQHGTRACQKLIDCLSTQMHFKLLEECLTPHIVGLVQDLNGNHVIQKCIQKFENEDLQFIIESICENMIKIATHKHGCCVLQKLLNKCNSQQVLRLGQEIIRNSILLMQDQFGNYVVQYLITLNINSLSVALIEIMIPYIGELSSQKFSSNVVEKCLKIRITNQNNAEVINPLFDALLQPSVLTTLIKDQYGNYVIQTAMDISPNSYKLRFATSIKPLLQLVRFTSFGKRIHNKVVTVLNEAERSEQQSSNAYMEGSLSGLLLNCSNNNNGSSSASGSDTRSSSCSLSSDYSIQQQSLLPAFQLNNSGSPTSAGNVIVSSRINDVEKFL